MAAYGNKQNVGCCFVKATWPPIKIRLKQDGQLNKMAVVISS